MENKDLAAVYARGRESLKDFSILTDRDYTPQWFHKEICKKLEAVEKGEISRLVIQMPPRHGKSQLSTINFPAWYLGRNPDKEIITASYNDTLAQDFGAKTRDLFNSEEYRAIFGTRIKPDSQSKAKWETTEKGAYTSVGVGGSLTGRGADILIIDDPVRNREDAESEVYRERVWNWYTSTARTRLEKGAAVIVIQCMTGDTPVLMADGTEKELRDIRTGDKVATYDNGELSASSVKNWRSNGRDSVLKITMKSGKIVRANERHPFLTYYNKELKWTRVKNLTTDHKIVTLKGKRVSGKEKSVLSVISRLFAGGIVCLTTLKRSGQMGIAHRLSLIKELAGARSLNTVMESLLRIMRRLMRVKEVYAKSVNNHQAKTCAPTGTESSVSTTVMTPERSGGCSATTVTSQSDIQKPNKRHLLWQNTSDFTLEDIVSIEDDGIEEVFDLQIDKTENFIANGVVSHNTRWHLDDLTGRLLERAEKGGEQWEIIRYPAIADSDSEYRKRGEPLWGDKYSKEDLEMTRKSIGERDWLALYQQSPAVGGSNDFKTEYFRYFEEEELQYKDLQYFTAVDLAISKKDTADNTVIRTIAKEPNNPNIYLIEETAGRFNPGQTLEAFFKHVEKYKPVRTGFEAVAYQQSLGYFIEEEQKRRGLYFPVVEIRNTTDKELRLRGLVPYYQRGVMFHRRSDLDLESEMLQFPVGKHDDRCLAAGTLVETQYGSKKIEDIKIGDKVLTPKGLKRVTHVFDNGVKDVVLRHNILGTHDHPVFAGDCFMSLIDVPYMNICELSITRELKWMYRNILSSMGVPTNYLGKDDIIYLNQIQIREERILKDFMWRFGSFLVKGQFLKALLFTTKTTIGLITVLKTLSVYHVSNTLKSILRIMRGKEGKNILTASGISQRNGIDPKMEDCGTQNTPKKYGLVGKRRLKKTVCSVRRQPCSIFHQENIVRTPVSKNSCIGKRRVFDITVEDAHCFYANGVLVGNCDALQMCIQLLTATNYEVVKTSTKTFSGRVTY